MFIDCAILGAQTSMVIVARFVSLSSGMLFSTSRSAVSFVLLEEAVGPVDVNAGLAHPGA